MYLYFTANNIIVVVAAALGACGGFVVGKGGEISCVDFPSIKYKECVERRPNE